MSDFPLLSTRGAELSRRAAARGARYVLSPRDIAAPGYSGNTDRGFWGGFRDTVGYVEDKKVRALGQRLFPNDPKYRTSVGAEPLNYGDVLVDAFPDAPKGLMVGIGVGLSVLDPFDWVNKAKILAPTKSGRLAAYLDRFRASKVLKQVDGGRWVIDEAALAAHIEQTRSRVKHLDNLVNSQSKTGNRVVFSKELKATKRELKTQERTQRHHATVQKVLDDAVAKGIDPATLTRMAEDGTALSNFELSRRGLQSYFSLGSPFRLDQPLVKRLGAFEDIGGAITTGGLLAHRGWKGGGTSIGRTIDAYAGAGIGKALGILPKGIRAAVKAGSDHMFGAGKILGQMESELAKTLQDVARRTHLDAKMMNAHLRSAIQEFAKKYKIDDEGVLAVLSEAKRKEAADVIEATGDPRVAGLETAVQGSTLRRHVEEMIDDAHRKGTRIVTVSGEPMAAADLFGGTQAAPKDSKWVINTRLPDEEVEAARVARDLSATAGKPTIDGFEHRIVNGTHIVMDAPHASYADSYVGILAKLENPEDIIGLTAWRKTTSQKDGKALLVGRRLHSAQKIKVPHEFDEGGTPFTYAHMENLEIMGAQLAERGYYLQALDPEDLLVNQVGGTQLLSTHKILPVTHISDRARKAASAQLGRAPSREEAKKMTAAMATRETLEAFSMRTNAHHEVAREYRHLESVDAVTAASKHGTEMAQIRRTVQTADPESLHTMSPSQLLELAETPIHHRGVLHGLTAGIPAEEIEKLVGRKLSTKVAGARQEIRAALARGDTPVVPPITIASDEAGGFHITRNAEWALAAALEDLAIVPIRTSRYFGPALSGVSDVVQKTSNIAEHFVGDRATLAARHLSKGLRESPYVAPAYKVHDATGKLVLPKDPAFVPQPQLFRDTEAFNAAVKNEELLVAMRGQIQNIAEAMSYRTRQGIDVSLTEGLVRTLLQQPDAYLKIRQLGDVARHSPENFARAAAELLDEPARLRMVHHPDVKAAHLATVQKIAQFDEAVRLESRRAGILSEEDIISGKATDFPGQVQYVSPAGHLYVIDGTKSVDQIRQDIDEILGGLGPGIPGLAPQQIVGAVGRDGTQLFSVSAFAKEGDIPRPVFTPASAKPINLTGEEAGDLWNDSRVAFVSGRGAKNDIGDGILRDKGVVDDFGHVLTREVEKGVATFERPGLSFVLTKNGDLFIGTAPRHKDANALLDDLFGDGIRPGGEFGVIDNRGVTINYPVVGSMVRWDAATIRATENRIKYAVGMMRKAGLAEDTFVNVVMPWQHQHWNRMFGHPRMSEILRDGWKLDVPKELLGMPLDVNMTTAQFAIRQVRPSFNDPETAAIFKLIEDTTDEVFRQDKLAGLPVAYRPGYIPHMLTTGAAKAIELMNRELMKLAESKDKKIVAAMKPFLKARSWSNLTIADVNQIMQDLRKAKAFDSDSALQVLNKRVIDGAQAGELAQYAEAMEKAGLDITDSFFHADPIVSLGFRIIDSAVERSAAAVIDHLAKTKAAGMLTVGQYKSLLKDKAELAGMRLQKVDYQDQLRAIERQLEKPPTDLEVLSGYHQSLKAVQKETTDKLESLLRKMHDKELGLGGTHSIAADLIPANRGVAYITRMRAEELHRAGRFPTEDLDAAFGDLVAVDAANIFDKLTDSERVLIFDAEMVPVVEQVFGITKDHRGFSKFLKYWDGATSLFKAVNLSVMPQYHRRNMFEAMWIAWVGGVDHVSMERSLDILGILQRMDKPGSFEAVYDALDNLTLTNRFGETISAREMFNQFTVHGGPSGGLHISELGGRAGNKGAQRDWARQVRAVDSRLTSTRDVAGNILDNPVFRAGRSFSMYYEDRARFAAFIDGWTKNGTIEAANLNMKKLFGDWNAMNALERQALRRIMPFYAWSRMNIPRSVELMTLYPGRIATFERILDQLQTAAYGEPVPDDIERHLLERFGIIAAKGKDGVLKIQDLGYVVPIYELFSILTRPGTWLVNGASPWLKIPIEQYLGVKSFGAKFTGLGQIDARDIEQFAGQLSQAELMKKLGITRRMRWDGPLGPFNLVLNDAVLLDLMRPVKEANHMVDWLLSEDLHRQFPGMSAAMVDMVFGKTYNLDPARARRAWLTNYKVNRGRINKLIQQHEALGHTDDVHVLKSLKMNLDLQYPGEN